MMFPTSFAADELRNQMSRGRKNAKNAREQNEIYVNYISVCGLKNMAMKT